MISLIIVFLFISLFINIKESYASSNPLFSYRGDFNNDGIVNDSDTVIFAVAYNAYWTQNIYNPQMDLNNDGKIDYSDVVLFIQPTIPSASEDPFFNNALSSADYLLWRDGTLYKRTNLSRNIVEYSNNDPTILIQNTIDAITSGTIYIRGIGDVWIINSEISINGKNISLYSEPTLKVKNSFSSSALIYLQNINGSKYGFKLIDGNRLNNEDRELAGLHITGCQN